MSPLKRRWRQVIDASLAATLADCRAWRLVCGMLARSGFFCRLALSRAPPVVEAAARGRLNSSFSGALCRKSTVCSRFIGADKTKARLLWVAFSGLRDENMPVA